MRFFVYFTLLFTLIFSCKPKNTAIDMAQEPYDNVVNDTIIIENEALEYKVIIFELGFQSWLVTQKPMWYYEQATLENRNMFYVAEWNRRVVLPSVYDPGLYEQRIDYQAHIDYGKEVNYLLFMYFEFFQFKYKQRL